MFRGVLLDLGGVVYVGEAPLPGAIAAIDRLREAGLAVRFVTNTTRTPFRRLIARLRGMGLSIRDDELFTPAKAARRIIERAALKAHLLVHPDLVEDFAGMPEGDAGALVVGDAGEAFTYAAMDAAFRQLVHGAKFLALANNRSFRAADGELSLDAGPFVAGLTFASRCEPVVLGKPSADFFHAAIASIDCDPREAVMVGDDVESDVAGAIAAGLAGVLVQTGKYSPGDEDTIAPAPDHVAADLAEACDWIVNA